METIINGVRRALKITKPRAIGGFGDVPRLGSKIHLDALRMKVSVNPSDELWLWLVQVGWRECSYPRDRRVYLDLPDRTLKELAKRHGLEREALYGQLLERCDRHLARK